MAAIDHLNTAVTELQAEVAKAISKLTGPPSNEAAVEAAAQAVGKAAADLKQVVG